LGFKQKGADVAKIKMGDTVECKISGFRGLAIADCKYLYGCRQFLVKPKGLTKDGHPVKSLWIDEPQLKKIKASDLEPAAPRHGGVRSHPGD
jgi:hypothetical protein